MLKIVRTNAKTSLSPRVLASSGPASVGGSEDQRGRRGVEGAGLVGWIFFRSTWALLTALRGGAVLRSGRAVGSQITAFEK